MRYGSRKVEEPRVLGIVILSLVAAIGYWRTQRRSRPTARIGEDVISPRKVYRLVNGVERNATVPTCKTRTLRYPSPRRDSVFKSTVKVN